MGRTEHSWHAVDHQHQVETERLDAISAAADQDFKRHVAAITTNLALNHKQTVDQVTEAFCHAIAQNGVAEHLVRVASSRPSIAGGSMLAGLVKHCIENIANEAVNKSGGLNMAAMRAVAPADLRVPA